MAARRLALVLLAALAALVLHGCGSSKDDGASWPPPDDEGEPDVGGGDEQDEPEDPLKDVKEDCTGNAMIEHINHKLVQARQELAMKLPEEVPPLKREEVVEKTFKTDVTVFLRSLLDKENHYCTAAQKVKEGMAGGESLEDLLRDELAGRIDKIQEMLEKRDQLDKEMDIAKLQEEKKKVGLDDISDDHARQWFKDAASMEGDFAETLITCVKVFAMSDECMLEDYFQQTLADERCPESSMRQIY